jgi:hypothetical protein
MNYHGAPGTVECIALAGHLDVAVDRRHITAP